MNTSVRGQIGLRHPVRQRERRPVSWEPPPANIKINGLIQSSRLDGRLSEVPGGFLASPKIIQTPAGKCQTDEGSTEELRIDRSRECRARTEATSIKTGVDADGQVR